MNAPTPAPSPFQLANVDKPPADRKQKAISVMFFGSGLLLAAGARFYRGDNPRTVLVIGAIGCLVLTFDAVWYGFLRSRGRQEQVHFWS